MLPTGQVKSTVASGYIQGKEMKREVVLRGYLKSAAAVDRWGTCRAISFAADIGCGGSV